MEKLTDIVYGPVPSRRLGRSLGVNNIPPKICSYSCVYCQLGKTTDLSVKREEYYKPDQILKAVEQKLKELDKNNQMVDYLSFVPDGEPTLDINLGKTLRLLKKFNLPTAVITNSSLLRKDEVRDDLYEADLVSCKIDSVAEPVWRKINRPPRFLDIDKILDGLKIFSDNFKGKLITETMLVENINDDLDQIEKNAVFLSDLTLPTAYISIPTRPPADPGIKPPDEQKIAAIYTVYAQKINRVELLIGYEGDDFSSTGDVRKDLLSITAVHPMREDAVEKLLMNNGASWTEVDKLVERNQLVKINYNQNYYYLRKIKIN
ncbi:MAG: radical SAM protein [Desulfuromonas sp. SDB]|nr:MAG: radical SAM protein [Desulfuromonas sp. SDB]